MLWDRRTGLPVHRAIVWQCRRSAPICERLRAAGLEPLVRARTGLVLDAYFSGTKIAWLLESRPELRAPAARGELAFGTVDSWLLWKLTGGRVHATDPSNASRTLCYDIRRLDWDPELTGHLGIPREVFPRVSPSASVFGETVAHDGLPAGIPVAGIAGDQQAALFGQGAVAPGARRTPTGRDASSSSTRARHPVASTAGLLSTVAWSLPPAGGGPPVVSYALEGAVFVAGAAVQWLRDGLGLIGSGGGDRAPGALGAGHRRRLPGARLRGPGRPLLGHVRAGRSGGAHPRDHARPRRPGDARGDRLPDPGRAGRDGRRRGAAPRELRVDGGATENDFLCQFQADVLGLPILRPRVRETTGLGAAYLAGLGVGLWRGPEALAELWQLDRAFEPAMSAERREALYAGWRRAVGRARDWAREGRLTRRARDRAGDFLSGGGDVTGLVTPEPTT